MYLDKMISGFQDELRKMAAASPPKGSLGRGAFKALAPVAAGALLWEGTRRANKDRQLGRQMRVQNQSQGY